MAESMLVAGADDEVGLSEPGWVDGRFEAPQQGLAMPEWSRVGTAAVTACGGVPSPTG